MLPTELLKTVLDRLIRLARGPWRHGESVAFRPQLEVLETRAAPGGLAFSEAYAQPPLSETALVRVTESLVIDKDPRRISALSSRPFDDRVFGDEPGNRVPGKDLDVLFAERLSFTPMNDLGADLTAVLRSGKDDTAFFFAQESAASDEVFLDAGW
jgi:hypothetical protein